MAGEKHVKLLAFTGRFLNSGKEKTSSSETQIGIEVHAAILLSSLEHRTASLGPRRFQKQVGPT